MKNKLKPIFKTIICVSVLFLFTGCAKKGRPFEDAGYAFLQNGQSEEALESFKKSLAQEKETKESLRGLGIANLSLGKYDEAIDAFVKALNKSNGSIKDVDFDINSYLGYAYEKAEKYEEAVKVYTAVLDFKPKDIDAYYRRAICYLKLGETTLADEDFAIATSKNNDDYDLHIRIYFSIKEAGFEKEADAYLTSLLNDSKRKISDYDRGRICYYLKDYSNARVYLEKAKDPSNPDTILMLGKTYEATGDNTYAASLYANYLDQKGNNAAVYNQLGVCRFKLQDYEGALAAFSFGLKLEDPEWMRELSYNEAVTYEYMGDFQTAKEKMEEYLKNYPKDENANHELLFLQTRQ